MSPSRRRPCRKRRAERRRLRAGRRAGPSPQDNQKPGLSAGSRFVCRRPFPSPLPVLLHRVGVASGFPPPGSSARIPRLRAFPLLRHYGSGRRVRLRLHAAPLIRRLASFPLPHLVYHLFAGRHVPFGPNRANLLASPAQHRLARPGGLVRHSCVLEFVASNAGCSV